MFTFHNPSIWFLTLLVIVPWLLVRSLRYRTESLSFSSTNGLDRLPRSWKQRLQWLPTFMTLLALLLLIVAVARPREGRKEAVSSTEGIAIELVVDRSGSMQALDFKLRNETVDRLSAIKDVASRFVLGGDNLNGRASDLIGLVTFARYADGITPPTMDHSFVVGQLHDTEIVDREPEDGTAIGDAIGLATEKLNGLKRSGSQKITSKVMILLTDGANNSGDIDPVQAAELASSFGVKIYTIGVGTKGLAPIPVTDPFTGRKVLRMMEAHIDEDTLTKIAELTGGKYFRATDTASLENIYKEIDELEKTKFEEKQYVEYREWAIETITLAGVSAPALAWLSLWLLAGREVLVHTLFRQFNP
ncbi:MAG: VWA domain-containing protein [Pirellulaceae bacterium]|nr:VWA domain-containing protein [Planctomycetales bacterium]